MIKKIIEKIFRLFFEVYEERYKIHKKNFKFKDPISFLNDFYSEKTSKFIQSNISQAMIFSDRKSVLKYAVDKCNEKFLNDEGLNLEFGVYNGKSINFISKFLDKVYGFDWFKNGLEEDWTGTWRSKSSTHILKEKPNVNNNVELIEGDIRETLPRFKNNKINFIHIDTDTYSICKFILSETKKNLKSGGVIVFDEFFGYPNYEEHEFKALYEVYNPSEFKFIAFSNKQAAIQII